MFKKDYWLGALFTLALLGCVGGGIWIGHLYAFAQVQLVIAELNTPSNLLDLIVEHDPERLSKEEDLARFAALYELEYADQELVEETLRNVGWVPAMKPSPFLGSQPRPSPSHDLFDINSHGFRDTRTSYGSRDSSVVRVFLTGGSVAFGAGAKSEEQTISAFLERRLTQSISQRTGYGYQVINTAVPAWSTTEERILIENQLIDLEPSLVVMLSGNNDVHWALIESEDVTDFWSYYARNFMTLVNNTYDQRGHPLAVFPFDMRAKRPSCSRVGRLLHRNVSLATRAAELGGFALVFALQPNLFSTNKELSPSELASIEEFGRGIAAEKPEWHQCYELIRQNLKMIRSPNFTFLDLSRTFSELGSDTEVFIDPYHFATFGNKRIAEILERKIDWTSLTPARSLPASYLASPKRRP